MENTLLTQSVEKSNPMKDWMVDYVGAKKGPENDQVTVEMSVDCMADEFPEFLMVVAEENWIRGYHQALRDVDEGVKVSKETEE